MYGHDYKSKLKNKFMSCYDELMKSFKELIILPVDAGVSIAHVSI